MRIIRITSGADPAAGIIARQPLGRDGLIRDDLGVVGAIQFTRKHLLFLGLAQPISPRLGKASGTAARAARAFTLSSSIWRMSGSMPVELQLVANVGDERNVELLAVEIALEVEQEDFKQWRAVVERRAPAETCHPVEAL